MKVKLTINDKEYEVEVTEEQVKELTKSKKPEHKRWRAPKGERYWALNPAGEVNFFTEDKDEIDLWRHKTGNYFKTKEEAKEYAKKIKYQQEYKDWCLNRNAPLKWKNINQMKFYATYNYYDDSIALGSVYTSKDESVTYASTEEIIQSFINHIGERNFKKYILEVE